MQIKDGYKCINCKKFVEKGNNVYIFKNMNDVLVSACGLNCVEEYKEKDVKVLKNKIYKLKNQNIEKDVW